jgi:hypothetical protein
VEKIDVMRNGLEQARFWSRKLYRRAIQEIGSRFYVNPDPALRKSILVAGTARSGTTWLGDLIASQIPCRILFEPFNPDLVPEYRGFHYFQYIRPGSENPRFHSFTQRVFTGTIRNRWIDHQNERIHSEYRLVKEIRINLALRWLHDNFPDVPILFLIRHPCAVVVSRMELGWATDSDIEPFLSQPDLVEDFLSPYIDVIRNAKTAEEKHAVIWCVSNLIPLRQFECNELRIVYYEMLCTQPKDELPAIFRSIRQKYVERTFDAADKPSQTTRVNSDIVTGKDRISAWKNKLKTTQIEKILGIVNAFGMGYLYGESLLPLSYDVQ